MISHKWHLDRYQYLNFLVCRIYLTKFIAVYFISLFTLTSLLFTFTPTLCNQLPTRAGHNGTIFAFLASFWSCQTPTPKNFVWRLAFLKKWRPTLLPLHHFRTKKRWSRCNIKKLWPIFKIWEWTL